MFSTLKTWLKSREKERLDLRPFKEAFEELRIRAHSISKSPVLGSFGEEWESLATRIGDFLGFLDSDDSDIDLRLASLLQKNDRSEKSWKEAFPFLFKKEDSVATPIEEEAPESEEQDENYLGYGECPRGPLYQTGGYQRHNHFRDFRKDLMGGSDEFQVGKELRDAIRSVCPKRELQPTEMKGVLRKAGFASMYQHSVQIGSQLNLFSAAKFTPFEREQLDGFFVATEAAWNLLGPEEKMDPTTGRIRTSILPLSYLTSKYLQFLGKWEFLFLTRMPKNMARLRFYDRVWKAICKRNDWDYVPTRQDFCV